MGLVRTAAWVIGIAAAAAAGIAASKATGSGAAPPKPDRNDDLDFGDAPIEPFTPAGDEGRRDPNPRARPGSIAFRDYVLRRFGGYDAGIMGDVRHMAGKSGHNTGRAWDWGTPPNQVKQNRKADVDGFLAWLFAPSSSGEEAEILRRAGIGYLIWNQRIWSVRTNKWDPYKGPDPHTTHVHISFSDAGADGTTSFYSALRKATPNV